MSLNFLRKHKFSLLNTLNDIITLKFIKLFVDSDNASNFHYYKQQYLSSLWPDFIVCFRVIFYVDGREYREEVGEISEPMKLYHKS